MFWMTAFVDLAPDEFERGVEFWLGVTGYDLSPARGEHDEFATLVPPDGDAHLRVQRLVDGPSRLHLDLHVEDPTAAADEAVALGATVVTRHELGYVVMSSPGGLRFCFVGHEAAQPAPPTDWGGGLVSTVDQVCLDVPGPTYETEFGFWRALSGWEERPIHAHPEFRRLIGPADRPLHLLVQRLEEQSGQVRAHFDLAASDQQTEVERHRALGATVAWFGDGWVVMTAPAGPAYCITGRSPGMRVLDVPASR